MLIRERACRLLSIVAITVIAAHSLHGSGSDAAADVPEGLKAYQVDNILRNGDFSQRALNRNAPAHWNLALDHWEELPGEMNYYSLADGTLRVQAPAPGVMQYVDITPITALEYTLSFEAEVETGTLQCAFKYGAKSIKAGKGFEKHSCSFKLPPGMSAAEWRVDFRPIGEGAVFKLRNVALKPTLPESNQDSEALYIDDAGKNIPLRGIAVADNNSVFEHFYDLKAAQYLRKYLYVSFGRVVPIYTGSKEAIRKEKGMVCFGRSFIGEEGMAKVTAGGYAMEGQGGNIYIAGKDDGAVHGAFALLAGMGMEFFAAVKDFTPATSDVLKLAKPRMGRNPGLVQGFLEVLFRKLSAKTTIVRNPSFAFRTSDWPILSAAPLGESCAELLACGRYVGQWISTDHTNGILVDPFQYFKEHPEYYALDKKGERSGSLASQQGLKGLENMTRNAATFRKTMNLCWSNPEVQKIASATALRWFELCPETKMISMIQGDNGLPDAFCQCENCQRFGVSDTDRYLRFVNVIAKAVREQYPEKMILAWSYLNTVKPPVNVVAEPNVILLVAVCGTGWGENGTSMKETLIDAQSSRVGVNWLSNWVKAVRCGPALYFPSTYEAVNKMRLFSDCGATTPFHVYGNYPPSKLDYLTNYIMRKVSWDLATDVEPHIDRFMAFYYGPAAPDMRQYFNLVEEKKMAFAKGFGDGNLGSDGIPLVVDHDALVKGLEYLGQAEAQVNSEDGKQMIRLHKLQFLNSYLLRSKSFQFQGEALERFAKCLAEALRLAKELNDNAPKSATTYREMVWLATGIEIGDTQPWHKSTVVQKILDDPLGMVKTNMKETYDKTEKGLKFDLRACAGGENASDYQYQSDEMRKAKRSFAKVLRRASSPRFGISAAFTLSGIPEQSAFLELVGLDDDKSGRAALKVLVNGETVFEGENTCRENDWTQMKILIPAKVLKKGVNTLEIKNATPEKTEAVADIYDVKDYNWGWFMLTEAELVFAPQDNPVVAKAPLILDAWKKARIDIFEGNHKTKFTARDGWGYGKGGSDDYYVWGESKKLSDKWEDWTISVVPSEDCTLTLWLRGPNRPKEEGSKELLPIWTEYDDLKIEGATLANPDFEALDDQGIPEGWKCVSANVVTGATAAEGKAYVKACFDQPVKQRVAAKAGQAVTISVKVRRGKEMPSLEP